MAKFLYVNGTSIFDYSNGACNSLLNIFERISTSGHKVFVVSGCSSTSFSSYTFSKRIWANNKLQSKNIIYRFIQNGVFHSLVKTENWNRNGLTSFEQETIYREAISIIENNDINFIIGWGNLLLEEAIFKEAKYRKIKLLFYLVNKFYKGTNTFILKNSDAVITDSEATKKLYSNELNCDCFVLPKFIKKPKEFYPEERLLSNNCLFVNPAVEKGLESFLLISKYLENTYPKIRLICRDAKNLLKSEIKRINKDLKDIPNNVLLKSGTHDKDELFRDIKVLLLLSINHESGSSLIYEAYSRGIPVIAFDVGGNAQLIGKFKENLFVKPKINKNSNLNPYLVNWDPAPICERISTVINNKNEFVEYSKKIKTYYDQLSLEKESINTFNKIINKLF